jgi:hypothetical protein
MVLERTLYIVDLFPAATITEKDRMFALELSSISPVNALSVRAWRASPAADPVGCS